MAAKRLIIPSIISSLISGKEGQIAARDEDFEATKRLIIPSIISSLISGKEGQVVARDADVEATKRLIIPSIISSLISGKEGEIQARDNDEVSTWVNQSWCCSQTRYADLRYLDSSLNLLFWSSPLQSDSFQASSRSSSVARKLWSLQREIRCLIIHLMVHLILAVITSAAPASPISCQNVNKIICIRKRLYSYVVVVVSLVTLSSSSSFLSFERSTFFVLSDPTHLIIRLFQQSIHFSSLIFQQSQSTFDIFRGSAVFGSPTKPSHVGWSRLNESGEARGARQVLFFQPFTDGHSVRDRDQENERETKNWNSRLRETNRIGQQ